MKRFLLVSVLTIILTFTLTSSALVSGNKVRGDNKQGEVNQVQVQNPPTFQP